MLDAASSVLPILLVALLLLSLGQRPLTRPPHEPRSDKREASLILVGLALALLAIVFMLQRVRAPDWALLPALVAAGAIAYALRRRFSVFRSRCPSCGRRLSLREVMFEQQDASESAPSGDQCPACH